ncbi:MAG TPA: IPT/TIG domain-containing protein [Candidatus Acidoferrales bacterium]|nr:IPT/TIG domain-containing protein [Candidatus Acidoferrales bacterium]
MRRVPLWLVLALIVVHGGCAGTTKTTAPPPAQVSVSVMPSTANVRVGTTQSFTASVTGTANQNVNWSVNGVAGGSAATGTISASGLYAAPASLPNPNTITISAVSAANSSASATSNVTLWNATPAISNVTPASFTAGAYTLTVTGSNFVSGAQVLFGGAAVNTTFVSSAKLTATGSETSAGMFGVSVSNPNPGSSTSSAINVTVTSQSGGNPPPPPPPTSACSGFSLGQGGSLNGFLPFPADNLWNLNIANATVDPNSAAIINFIGPTDPVHPDFGSGEFDGSSIGIPYIVVDSDQAPVAINFTESGDESDPGPMPVPASAPIEGFPNPGNGDRHVLVLDDSTCWLYELFSSFPQSDGSWNAGSAAVWDLTADEQRPLTWTSADAAGLSIFAGLARYDEVASGEIKHALRFTLQNSRAAFTLPASHWAANSTNANAAPMGMRMRLKASFDVSQFSATNQVILRALQQYGMIMADNGSNMFISGAPDDRWDNDDLHNLDQVTAADFEVVTMNPVYTQANLPTGATPVISAFTASSSTVSAGAQVTLQWNATGASYFDVTPQVGAIRGTSVVVTPSQTTTYTLNATNEFGRTTSTVTVTVQ